MMNSFAEPLIKMNCFLF